MQFCETLDEQSLREEQFALEEEHDTEAVRKVLNERRESLDKGDVHYNPQVHNLLRSALPKVKEVLAEYRNATDRGINARYRPVLQAIDLDVLAASTIISVFSHYFSCIHKDKPIVFQGLARYVGHATVVELMVSQSAKVNPMYMAEVFKELEKTRTTSLHHIRLTYRAAYKKVMAANMQLDLSASDYVCIGKFGVDACYQAGLIYNTRTFVSGKTQVLYHLNPEVEQYLYSAGGEGALSRVVSSTYRRMICVPDKWTSPFGGGYLTDRRKVQSGLIVHPHTSPGAMREYAAALAKSDMSRVYDCANYLQEVAYTLHHPTLELVREAWQAGGGMFGIPRREMRPKPEFPFESGWQTKGATEEQLQTHRIWRRRARDWYTEANRNKAKQREVWGFLRYLDTGHDRMYFPVFMDRRGRWYYRAYPNPQGSDISRAVLHFYNKKPLGKDGLYWLKVHIANLLGVDDIRFDARVAYVEKHWEDFERALDSPLDHHEVFGDEAPVNAYSAMYELRQALRCPNPEEYHTGIPVHMDATVSGTQHFSALLRDPVGAKYSSLIDSGLDTKVDLYTAVAERALEAIRADLRADRNVREATLWLRIGVPRNLAKRPVMVYTYNVTLFSVCNYIQDYLDDNHPEFGQEVDNAALRYLGNKLFDAIGEIIPATVEGMKYLGKVGTELGREGPIHWNTPLTGMMVYHEYPKSKIRQIRVRSAGLSFTTVREQTDEMRPAGMRSALAPNFIHSLDAAHLTLTALRMRDLGLDMVGIHDSFGTHPGDVPTLHRVLREEFVNLYSQDILGEFKRQVQSEIDLPKQGDFDLNEVFNSEFMFS